MQRPLFVIPRKDIAIVSGDFCEYDVSTAAEKYINLSVLRNCSLVRRRSESLDLNCSAHAFVLTCFLRSKLLNTSPVALPRRPWILFFHSLVPTGTFSLIRFTFSGVRVMLSSKLKNQCVQPSLGSSLSSSSISAGVPALHSGSGLLWFMYSEYTGREGSSGFSVPIK